FGDESEARGTEALYAVVARVHDPKPSFCVAQNPFGRHQFPIAAAFFAELGKVFAFLAELLEAVVAGVGDPRPFSGFFDGYAGWGFELAFARAFFPGFPDEFAFGVELLQAIVARVDNPDVVGGVDRDSLGGFEFSVARAFFAEFGDAFAFFVELLDAII